MEKNLLVLTNNIAGLHNFRKEVMKALVDEGYLVYISEPDDDQRVEYFKGIGCHIIKTKFDRRGMNPIADFWLLLNYWKMIRKIKPLAVLTYTIKPNVYGGIACRLTGTSLFANVTGLGDALENAGWLQKLTILLYKYGLGKARCVFFQNQNNKEFCFLNKINGEKSILLPGSGVNLNHHQYQEYPSDGKVIFLFISRLIKDKGTDEFFEMTKVVKKKYPETEFQILGYCGSDYQQKLDDYVKRGLVTFLGSTSDIRPYLRNIHCTIMPSYHEGMSNVNLESAANGRPVITTNVPGCKETIDDGITGFLIEARNVNSLINAVERFINLPYSQKILMGQEARRKVEREFDRRIVVNAYLNELR